MNNNINYIQTVEETLKKADMNYHIRERDESTVFMIPFRAENLPAVNVSMRVEKDGDVKLSVFPIRKVADRFRTDVLEILNEFNTRYRFTCFALDFDGDIRVDYDMALMSEDPEELEEKLVMLLMLFADIVDETYVPMFLAARCGLKIAREVLAQLENGNEKKDDEEAEDEDSSDFGVLTENLESLLAMIDTHSPDDDDLASLFIGDDDVDDDDDFDDDDDDDDESNGDA